MIQPYINQFAQNNTQRAKIRLAHTCTIISFFPYIMMQLVLKGICLVMLGCKTYSISNTWLGLASYDDVYLTSTSSYINQ